MDMKKVKISIECGIVPPDDGIVKVWYWRDDGKMNEEWEAKVPIWYILNARKTFLLCVAGETIKISKEKLDSNFNRVQ